MFKKFLPNKDFSFSLDGSYKFKDQVYPSTGVENELHEIIIDDNQHLFTRQWLGLLSHFEVDLPASELWKVSFHECDSRVLQQKCKHVMLFSRGIESGDGFFIIPGFTRFAITVTGIVKSLKYGKILKQRIGPYGYPEVSIYDADKGKWRGVNIHLLLARTFIKNTDPSSKFFVNHIDGNKLNFELTNLEWVTPSENQRHAFENGLRTDNRPCRVFDHKTKEVKSFASIGLALKDMGFIVKSANIARRINGKIVPILLKGQYEIKLHGDDSEWFYNAKNLLAGKNTGYLEAKHIASSAVVEAKTINRLSEMVGVSVNTIDSVIKHLEIKSAFGYLFRNKSDESWPEIYSELTFVKPRRLKITDLESGIETLLPSIRKGCQFTGIDKRTLKNRLKTNKPYKSFTFEEIE